MKQSKAIAGTPGVAPVWVAIMAAAIMAAAVVGSCIDDGTVLCATGLRCPVDYTCTSDGSACTNTLCGNGVIDDGELCDDGNLRPGDGCIDCKSDGRCGNGIVDLGEDCEPGALNGRACDSRCQFSCGNQQLDPDEECDRSLFRVTCIDLGFDRGSASCDATACVAHGTGCAQIGWHRDARLAAGTSALAIGDLHGVWGADNGQIYAVGTDGSGSVVMILHFNGQSWRIDKQGPNPGALLDVWGSSSDDAFAVGEGGRALYLNESGNWLALNTRLPAHIALRGVWGAGKDGDILAVGDGATIIRFIRSSGAWLPEPLRSVPPETVFEAVWGRDANEAYAVGHGGVILRYTEREWVREAPGLTGADLLDVWGAEDGTVFAAGAGGVILRRNQDGWTIMDSPQQRDLHALWGSSSDSVFAAGERGTTLFYDGLAWRTLVADTDSTLTDMWSAPGYGLVGVAPNGVIMRLDTWSWMPLPAQESSDAMRSMWARGLDDVYGVFDGHPYLRHFDGDAWSEVDIDALLPPDHGASPLRALWGAPAGDLYAVGDDKLVLRRDPITGWERMHVPDTIPASHFAHAWRGDDGHLFVAGALAGQNDGIIVRHDGGSWQQMVKNQQTVLRGIWGASSSEVYAVGTNGVILRYDGNPERRFELMNSGTQENLNAIWGSGSKNIHVVGDHGVALAFNGNVWSLSTNIFIGHLYDVWGSGEDHVFAVGSGGSLLHRTERKWAVVSSGTDQRLTSIDGVDGVGGEHRVVTFGGEGAAFRRFLVNDDTRAGY